MDTPTTKPANVSTLYERLVEWDDGRRWRATAPMPHVPADVRALGDKAESNLAHDLVAEMMNPHYRVATFAKLHADAHNAWVESLPTVSEHHCGDGPCGDCDDLCHGEPAYLVETGLTTWEGYSFDDEGGRASSRGWDALGDRVSGFRDYIYCDECGKNFRPDPDKEMLWD